MNLHQKLIEIRKAVPYLQQIENNTQQQFKYTSSSQVLFTVRQEMDKHGVLLIPQIETHFFHEKTTIGGKQHFTELEITFTWIDGDNVKDTIVCPWYSQGADQQEKGVGKALTYAEKFFILKFFNIATDKDDPDAFEKRLENGAAGNDKKGKPDKSLGKCPSCGAEAVIKSDAKYGGGWVCWKAKGGCGAKYTEDPGKQKPDTKPKALGAKQGAALIKMGADLEVSLSSKNVTEMIDDYCEGHGGRTFENGQYMIKNFQKVLDAYIDKKTGDISEKDTKTQDQDYDGL